jgi:hypothetical protein
MGIDKSKVKIDVLQSLGKKFEGYETQKLKQAYELLGGAHALNGAKKEIDGYLRKFNEDYMKENDIDIESLKLIKKAVLEIQESIGRKALDNETSYNQILGQCAGVNQMLGILKKEFESEVLKLNQAESETDNENDTGVRPVGKAPERKVGNPRFMNKDKEENSKKNKKEGTDGKNK